MRRQRLEPRPAPRRGLRELLRPGVPLHRPGRGGRPVPRPGPQPGHRRGARPSLRPDDRRRPRAHPGRAALRPGRAGDLRPRDRGHPAVVRRPGPAGRRHGRRLRPGATRTGSSRPIEWPGAGYRLFEIGHFIGDRDWLDGVWESNCMFVTRAQLEQVGGFDESFSMAGGGYANLELYERLGSSPDVTVATILGEGSFHQVHGGTTTNQTGRRSSAGPGSTATASTTPSCGAGPSAARASRSTTSAASPRRRPGAPGPAGSRRRRSPRARRPGASTGCPTSPTPMPEEQRVAFAEAVWRTLPVGAHDLAGPGRRVGPHRPARLPGAHRRGPARLGRSRPAPATAAAPCSWPRSATWSATARWCRSAPDQADDLPEHPRIRYVTGRAHVRRDGRRRSREHRRRRPGRWWCWGRAPTATPPPRSSRPTPPFVPVGLLRGGHRHDRERPPRVARVRPRPGRGGEADPDPPRRVRPRPRPSRSTRSPSTRTGTCAACHERPAVTSPAGPVLSVVVVVHDMARELPRTLRTLDPTHQRGIDADDYEVVVVDNGSAVPVDRSTLPFSGTLRVERIDPAPPSPARAANHGLAVARGALVGLVVDGARMASPRLLATARRAALLADRPVVTAPAYHLGEVPHMRAAEVGHDQRAEDALLAGCGWEDDGDALFGVSTFAGSSHRGWFGPMGESSSLFLDRSRWEELGRARRGLRPARGRSGQPRPVPPGLLPPGHRAGAGPGGGDLPPVPRWCGDGAPVHLGRHARPVRRPPGRALHPSLAAPDLPGHPARRRPRPARALGGLGRRPAGPEGLGLHPLSGEGLDPPGCRRPSSQEVGGAVRRDPRDDPHPAGRCPGVGRVGALTAVADARTLGWVHAKAVGLMGKRAHLGAGPGPSTGRAPGRGEAEGLARSRRAGGSG